MAQSSETLLAVRNLCAAYGRETVLRDVSLDLYEGEVVALIGPSGSGKSTLLLTLSMLLAPTSGTVSYRGRTVFPSGAGIRDAHVRQYLNDIGVVFQQLHLWPHLSLKWNVMLPLVFGLRWREADADERASHLLRSLGMPDLLDALPDDVSVGQQQRCAIARTLALSPKILFLDEITSALDPELVSSILDIVREIAEDPLRTLLIVTHEMTFAVKASDRIAYMEEGQLVTMVTSERLISKDCDNRLLKFVEHADG